MISYKNKLFIALGTLFLTSCGGGSQPSSEDTILTPLSISASGFKSDIESYEPLEITISSNYDCSFILSGDHINWINTTDNKTFSYRGPVVLRNNVMHNISISTIANSFCPNGTINLTHNVSKNNDILKFNPSPPPYNFGELNTPYFASHGLGFGGIELTDRFSATICYPTPEDCQLFENELFGQDAHNMATGDFNGDGFEDLVVAWALFPHTIEPSEKVDAPIHIYLNDGRGNLYEDLSIYYSGEPPTHPYAYRLAVADYNDDGFDDVFAGSMGLQYRDPDYSNNFILPYPHMLILSDSSGRFLDASDKIDDQNEGKGMACGFSHDASTGDFDNDGDHDIYACNLLLVNDGEANFAIHPDLGFNLQQSYGNPMSSLMVDLNNDDYDDLVFWNFDNRWNFEENQEEGFILLSNGTDTISSWALIPLPVGPFEINHNKYNHAVWGDLDNDGNNDVVIAITRDLPYYEGAYVQVLMGDGQGNLIDTTSTKFPNQPRIESHHGEGNIYLRDFNNDGFLDIFHSTRDYQSTLHGAHIALNDQSAGFSSISEDWLPKKPKANEWDNNPYLFKGVPINLDNLGCLDLVSTSDSWMDNSATRNYLYSILNTKCD